MAKHQPQKTGILSKLLKVLTVPLAAGAGYWFGQTSIRDSAYDNAKTHGAFDDMNKDHFSYNGKSTGKNYHDTLSEVGSEALKAVKNEKTFDIVEKASHLHVEREAQVAKRLEQIGLGTLGKQWKFTSKYQRQQALMNAFTAAGITIGALLSIADTKMISQAFTRKQSGNEEERSR